MRVAVYPADRSACGYYRLLWPAGVLRQAGHDIIIRPDEPLEHADVVVVQRPTFGRLARLIPALRAQGTAVVVDMDDDLLAVDPRNPGWARFHPAASPELNWRWAADICRQATLVTCSTRALADRYGQAGRTRLLPNYVPARFLELGRELERDPVLGWAGTTATHPGDLQAAGNALARLGRPLRVIGPEDGVARALGVADRLVDATGWVPFDEWPAAVAELDVGIAPLADTRFNRAKSWLKPLEYSALGVAWVATDLPEYRRLADLGAGTVASKPKAWLRELRRLLDDDGWRADQVARGRELAGRLTVEEHAWQFWEAWAEAAGLEHARRTG